MRKEESNTEEECVLAPDKRPCGRLTPLHELESSKSACASSGDGWQPPTPPTAVNEAKAPLLPSSAASTVPTRELNATTSLSSSIDMLTTGVAITPNTSEVKYPKDEPADLSFKKHIDESEGECYRQRSQAPRCDICGNVFSHAGNLNVHIKAIHKALRPFACEICGKDFSYLSHKKTHVNSVHKILRPFACEICGSTFGLMSHKKDHINAIHKNLREFVCYVCERAFTRSSTMKKHIQTIHEDLREYVCEFCGKAFSQRSNLKTHIQNNHEDKKRTAVVVELREAVCDFCGKAFARRSGLKQHIGLIHKKSHSYECWICGNGFSTKSNRQRHIRTVHEESTQN